MNQYPGSRSGGDPDSRSQQPASGHRFGGGLHGLPATDVAQDPDAPPMPENLVDSDFVEAQKTRFRAEALEMATGGSDGQSIGTETGMGEGDSSTGTAPDDDGAKSNLTGSQQSTSAVDADPDQEKRPGTDGASKPN